MKIKLPYSARVVAICATLLFGLLPPSSAQSASAATADLSGVVSNESTKASLEGATVELAGTNRRVLTDASGQYEFSRLPPGAYTVVVQYPGLDRQTRQITATAGQRTTEDVGLGSAIYQLQEFRITAEREGNAAAITKQRNADNMVNVVALDAYGDVADGNLGNFMQKLPGVTVQIAEGDAVGVMLRGTPPQMTMTSLDGIQMSDAGGGDTGKLTDRSAIIDRIPTEFIKEVEVTKASTPDMDASGLGGGTNLVTKSAFDFKERYAGFFQAGYNRNIYRSSNPWTPTAAFTLMRRFGAKQNFGLTLSGSYTSTIVTRDRVEPTIPDATNDIRTGLRFLDDTYHRIREGIGAKLEYRPAPGLTLHFNSLFSRYVSDTDRYDERTNEVTGHLPADYSVVSFAAISAGATPMTSAKAPAGIGPGATSDVVQLLNRTWTNVAGNDVRTDQTMFFNTGATKKWAETELTIGGSYAFNQYNRHFDQFTATLPGVGFLLDRTANPKTPAFTQIYGPSITDLSNYTGKLSLAYQHPRDRQGDVTADLQRTFDLGQGSLRLKGGVKFQEETRRIFSYSINATAVGADGVVGVNPATKVNDDNLSQFLRSNPYGLFQGYYAPLTEIDYGKIRSNLASGGNYFLASPISLTPATEATEDLSAAYAMGEYKQGKLTILSGLRVEHDSTDASGVLKPVTGNSTLTSRSGDYTKLFPGVHLRYAIRPELLMRASFSTTMARPTIANTIPTTTISTTGGGTVTQNNTNLGPEYSKNYDLDLEYYFNSVGVLSFGAYRKDITGFIASQTSPIPFGNDNGFDGNYAGYNLVTMFNLSSAEVKGFEFNYDQQLRMLPKPFNTLSIFANYTRVYDSGTYDSGAGALPQFVPKEGSAGLSYSIWRLQLRASYNYTGGYLYGYNANPASSTWNTRGDTVNLNVQYRITPWLNFSVNVANLFNTWPKQYSLNEDRLVTYEVYGTRVTLGVSGHF